jgi:ATP synthase protein I
MSEQDNDSRLAQLKDSLNQIKSKDQTANSNRIDKDADEENQRLGLRAGTELITPIIAGGLIGYWLDGLTDLKPLFLIAFLVLGVITGFVNVWRTTQNMGHKVGYKDQLDKTKTENDHSG